ncbi:MAG: tetratricopeptide repeat protein [Nitrospinae bacterium]|nr:tetratricopeptide repeat protein [Nitrospinota bacterium]
MRRGWLLVPVFAAFLYSDSLALDFTWPGKGKKEGAGKAEKLCAEANRAYGSADYAKTVELAGKAIQEDNGYAKAYLLRGKASKDMGNIDQAFKDLNRAIELDPKSGEAFFMRGQAHDIMGDMKKSEEDYKKGCALGYKEACQ